MPGASIKRVENIWKRPFRTEVVRAYSFELNTVSCLGVETFELPTLSVFWYKHMTAQHAATHMMSKASRRGKVDRPIWRSLKSKAGRGK
jgi:hypothetical protein